MSRTYYFHYRGGTSPVSISFRIDDEKNIVVWDAAFCSDKDLFSKRMGRYISESRLEVNLKKSSHNYFYFSNKPNVREIRRIIVELLENHPFCPESFTHK